MAAETPNPADVYELGKIGDWNAVLRAFENAPDFARACAAFRKPSSGWTLLHQAAYFGHEEMASVLVKYGASVSARATDGSTPAQVAASRRFAALAKSLRRQQQVTDESWNTCKVVQSSQQFREAKRRIATHDFLVAYAGGRVRVYTGDIYFVDSSKQVIIGWHGTYNPPRGMDAETAVDVDAEWDE